MQIRLRAVTVLAAVAFAAAPAASFAQQYPVQNVTLVTHSSPGGGSDVFLRTLIKHLQPKMGVNFVVENVSGGSGARAMSKVAQAPADGSVLYATTPTYIQTTLLSKPTHGYDSLMPVVNVFYDPEVLFVRKDSPYKTLREAADDAWSGIDASSLRPNSNSWPVRISRVARSTVSGFMWLPAPR